MRESVYERERERERRERELSWARRRAKALISRRSLVRPGVERRSAGDRNAHRSAGLRPDGEKRQRGARDRCWAVWGLGTVLKRRDGCFRRRR